MLLYSPFTLTYFSCSDGQEWAATFQLSLEGRIRIIYDSEDMAALQRSFPGDGVFSDHQKIIALGVVELLIDGRTEAD